MGRDPENPDSFEDIEKEARDLVEENNEASIFSKKEILLTLKEKFRMKRGREQKNLINNYKGGVGRREFLKILGLTAGSTYMSVNGAGFLMGKKVFSDHTNNTITGMATADSCDVFSQDDITEGTIEVSSGEVLSDVVLDQRDGLLQVIARGDNWSIRNVGVRGIVPAACEPVFSLATDGGEGSISSVFLAGSEEGPGKDECRRRDKSGSGITGIFVHKSHAGAVNIDRCNIQGMYDNGIYGSAPTANDGGGGTVHIENCFAANCNVSHFRLPEGTVENSVVQITDDWYSHRGIWAWGQAEVRNCVLDMNGKESSFDTSNGAVMQVYNTEYDDSFDHPIASGANVELVDGNGTNPDPYMPDGVPTSFEEAAGCEVDEEDQTGYWGGPEGSNVDSPDDEGSGGYSSGGDSSSGSSGSGGVISSTGRNGVDDGTDTEFSDDVEYNACE